MQIYSYTYRPAKFTSFLVDYIFDNLMENPMDNDTSAQDEVANESDVQAYPIEIKVAGKVAALSPHKRADLGDRCRTAIDEAIDKGFVEGSLTFKHNITDSLASLHFMKDVDGLRWDTHFMEISGPEKAFEIIRNMGFTKLACGENVESNPYMCQITNVYTDVVTPDSDEGTN